MSVIFPGCSQGLVHCRGSVHVHSKIINEHISENYTLVELFMKCVDFMGCVLISSVFYCHKRIHEAECHIRKR